MDFREVFWEALRSIWRYLKRVGKTLNQVKQLFLLFAILLISAVFTVIREPRIATFPDDSPLTIPYFPFSDYELTKGTYIYFMMQHIGGIFYSTYILITSDEFRTALKIFLGIHVVGLLDYLLNYGEIWFYTSTFPVSWNVLKAVVFMIAIINEVLLIKERDAMLR